MSWNTEHVSRQPVYTANESPMVQCVQACPSSPPCPGLAWSSLAPLSAWTILFSSWIVIGFSVALS